MELDALARVPKTERALRWYWAVGDLGQRCKRNRGSYGSDWSAVFEGKLKLSGTLISRTVKFREKVTDTAALADFEATPATWTLVQEALSIPDEEFWNIVKGAVDKGWSARDLRADLARFRSRHRSAPAKAVHVLTDLARRWAAEWKGAREGGLFESAPEHAAGTDPVPDWLGLAAALDALEDAVKEVRSRIPPPERQSPASPPPTAPPGSEPNPRPRGKRT